MSKYHMEGLNILKVALLELKSIKYTQFTRNKIRSILALKNNKTLQEQDTLKFRNECFAYYSLMKQELHQKDLTITTAEHLRKTMKNNYWVK
ncbi:unnamed protein product (macronuclear) [Paramecium tetraurelia]|uniref:Uncharacterized protein n=1 Tax=Paramecium tetraurelia TaxID=5888 RepID=A0BLD9_PARTE|nr:uncharacterized protein GSPATT00029989001 [Paramecium tetraurelia]CAK59356.1 unnamed protein product [Paramecium tetraurelia]|eukprot:XP_001426754.1 hypothetical protein (macronuclear) [Paramecium tetraurelia strain d4-2]